MTMDHQSLLDALDAAVAELAQIPASVRLYMDGIPEPLDEKPPMGLFVDALFRVTKLLFDAPLCIVALSEERASRRQNLSNAEEAVRQLCATVRAEAAAIWPYLKYALDHADPADQARASAMTSLATLSRWPGANVPTGVLLEGLGSESSGIRLTTLDDVLRLRLYSFPSVEQATKSLRSIKNADVERWTKLAAGALERLRPYLETGYDDAVLLTEFVQLEGLYFADRLHDVHGRLSALSSTPQTLPWSEDDPLRWLDDKNERANLIASAQKLARIVRHRVRHSVLPVLVMDRLVAYLERFARLEILDKLENRAGKNRKPEQTVQAEVDRFVFLAGMYPITHAVAGRGNLDTFIQEARPLLDDAERPGNAAVLIELKQALSAGTGSETTELQVTDAIRDALVQADDYKRQLDSYPRWKGHAIFAVVVYDGRTKYRIEDPRVMLVYLGTATPSAGSTLITLA